ncbi:uncharacterized protein LOC120707280 isoform X2 [Panicum virgatum]|uniref:uncharacterized protein LOC120707280 isoform X2 n=1 Tax=Panicum virgatum TaxID=38727 RepID=UPI0019D5967F|nr:uncharacterized protein LOC120707280 isoform X2 [Panicum virgatum]
MDPLNNTQDGRRLRRERERFLAASMTDEQREEKNRKRREITITDEQREEKNRKRREAYKRKKCQSHNKENDPAEEHDAPTVSEHPMTQLFSEHSADSVPDEMVRAKLFDAWTDIPPDEEDGASITYSPTIIEHPTSLPITEQMTGERQNHLARRNLLFEATIGRKYLGPPDEIPDVADEIPDVADAPSQSTIINTGATYPTQAQHANPQTQEFVFGASIIEDDGDDDVVFEEDEEEDKGYLFAGQDLWLLCLPDHGYGHRIIVHTYCNMVLWLFLRSHNIERLVNVRRRSPSARRSQTTYRRTATMATIRDRATSSNTRWTRI